MTFYEYMKMRDENNLNEGPMWDKFKTYGKSAAIGGASLMAGMNYSEPQTQNVQPQQAQIRSMFDNYSSSNNKMTPVQWRQMASNYGHPNAVGFVPDPAKPGAWIPGNGADSMRVQSRTQINNDELTSDEIALTPYKNGSRSGPTNHSNY